VEKAFLDISSQSYPQGLHRPGFAKTVLQHFYCNWFMAFLFGTELDDDDDTGEEDEDSEEESREHARYSREHKFKDADVVKDRIESGRPICGVYHGGNKGPDYEMMRMKSPSNSGIKCFASYNQIFKETIIALCRKETKYVYIIVVCRLSSY
jgi:hypothetical protein